MDGIKREIMFEKDWNQPCVHIDVPVPYEEDYQMKMLRYNEIDGLLRVSGIGREDEADSSLLYSLFAMVSSL